ncbi:MAG: hypothetical protein PHN58_00400, partial [Candidatus Cloacimonetes bacterium]|nr:hypothetical protein [Candidatus Cloacimonadota bacterium]
TDLHFKNKDFRISSRRLRRLCRFALRTRILGLDFRNKDLRILGLRGFIYKPPKSPKSPKKISSH